MEKEYDIRNDEEQEKKSEEVLELLVTAGYFRARIKVRSDNLSFSANLLFFGVRSACHHQQVCKYFPY